LFADLVLINGKIICVDDKDSSAESIAVKQGRIIRVGGTTDIQDLVGPDTVILDLNGKVVLPGFIDSHTHPAIYGTSLVFEVDCSEASSIVNIIQKIMKKVRQSPKGSWIRAYGYDEHKLAEKRPPTRWDLDKATSENPVAIRRICTHIVVLNSLALKITGINRETPDPEGGVIDRDPATGEPTGLLREKAAELAWKAIPDYTVEEIKQGLKLAFRDILSWGITTIHDAGVSPDLIQAYQELRAEGKLPLRVNLVIKEEHFGQDLLSALTTLRIKSGFGDEWLKITGIKFIADGSIGGRTAALYEPYAGETENSGILAIEPMTLNDKVMKAHKNGLQVCIHAIGDRAIDMALNAIEIALKENPQLDHRHRIEHCGVCTPRQLQRIKKVGAFVSASTSFLYELGDTFRAILGEEYMKWCYPHRSFIDYGIVVAGNSDLGAAHSANSFLGIYASATRKNWKGKVCAGEQSISVKEAIRSYTIEGARLGFDEKTRGSIEEGKLADLVVLSEDPLSVPLEHLKDIKVDITIVNGEIRFRREED